MANSFGDILRGLGSVLNPQVAQEDIQQEAEKRNIQKQFAMLALQRKMQEQSQERLSSAVRPFIENGDLEGAAGALAGVPGGLELGLKLREQAEARRSREALAKDTAARATAQFEQNLDLRRDTLNFQREQALQAAKTSGERAAADKWFREQTLKLREDGLRIQEQVSKGTGQQIVGNEGKLRDDYNQLSKTFIGVRDAHQRVMASANEPSAAGDLSLIFNYMKILDPTSVVRESEFAQAASTGAYGERIKAAANKAMKGERLSDVIRKDFLDRSQRLYDVAEQNQIELEDRFANISRRSNANPENVIIPYRTSKPKSKKDDAKPSGEWTPEKEQRYQELLRKRSGS